MKKALPIGYDDFCEIITENFYYIDKSLLIKEILEYRSKVILIPRPRRFGKTLNMSMLKYFFEKSINAPVNYGTLFNNLAVNQYAHIMSQQGQYPIISLTFKDVKQKLWQETYIEIKRIVANEFRRHRYLTSNNVLDKIELAEFEQIIACSASDSAYRNSLKSLSCYLERYHGAKAIVLIDEYDSPIHTGFIYGFYDDVIDFMRNFLGGGLKDNASLKFSVITGILRIAKESIFSGLNNIDVCTFTSNSFVDTFGLTQAEVSEMLEYYEIMQYRDAIKAWYKGYSSGPIAIYNPWSIMHVVKNKGELQPYWINTSDNALIKKLLLESDKTVKEDLEVLLDRKSLTKPLDENTAFLHITNNQGALWNFLFACGYLTFQNKRLSNDIVFVDFLLPNKEVEYFYRTTIQQWFKENQNDQYYNYMVQALVTGDITTFKKIFSITVVNSFSYFDISGNYPEKFYHAFVLGMLVHLMHQYQVKSNRESGFGRYDVMIIPHDKSKRGVIIEFKSCDGFDHETLESAAASALAQIKEKKYAQELLALGITKITTLAIAFQGKQVLVVEAPYSVE